jgi:tetratricopeptide (TPR) repeat protein
MALSRRFRGGFHLAEVTSMGRWLLRWVRSFVLLVMAVQLGAAQTEAGGLSGQEIYRQTLRSTAWVITSKNRGTGWLLDRDERLLVTSFHVVGDEKTAEVIFPAHKDGKLVTERTYYRDNKAALRESGLVVSARVIHRDKNRDLALLELKSVPAGVVALPLASDSPSPGERLHSIGNRGDLESLWIYTAGAVRQVCRARDGYTWQGETLAQGALVVVTQSPINEGDSGGPMVNDCGELVGVAAAVRWAGPVTSVAIDVSEVKAFVEQARAGAKSRDPAGAHSPAKKPDAGARRYRQVLQGTAWVQSDASSKRCSGWLCDRARRLLITSCPATGNRDTVRVTFPLDEDGRIVAESAAYQEQRRRLRSSGLEVRGHVLARDGRRCLALVELESVPAAAAGLTLAAADPEPGESVHVVGNPNNVESLWVYAVATVRQLGATRLGQGDEREAAAILLELPPRAEDSGGPVVNDRGEVLGILSDKEGPQQLVSYAVAGSEVRAVLNETRRWWDPRTAADHRRRGALFTRTRNHEQALADYIRAIELEPDHAETYSARARVYLRMDKVEKALADCERALQLDARLVSAYCQRAAALGQKGEARRALDDCAKALRLDPDCAVAHAIRARLFRLRDEADKALAECDEAIRLDPQLPEAYAERAMVYNGKGDPDRAIIDWTRVIEFDPLLAMAHRQRGDAYRASNQLKPAVADYTQALELDEGDAVAWYHRGLTWSRGDEHERAIADFSEALRLDPKNAEGYLHRGDEQVSRRQVEPALADYGKALQLQPQLVGDVLHDLDERGADLCIGDKTDPARGCVLYRGGLELCRGVLKDRAELQKLIGDGLVAAEREVEQRGRCLKLREILLDVRARLERR